MIGFNIGESKEGHEGCVPTLGSKFFQFHAVFAENFPKSYVGALPGGLAPPPRGNPGSPTGLNIRLWSFWRSLVLLQLVPDFSRSAVYFDTLASADTD